jgi:hypothetical protein
MKFRPEQARALPRKLVPKPQRPLATLKTFRKQPLLELHLSKTSRSSLILSDNNYEIHLNCSLCKQETFASNPPDMAMAMAIQHENSVEPATFIDIIVY